MRIGPDRKVVFALLAIAALCVIGLGATLYRSKVAELSRLRDELVDKKAKLGNLHDKLAAQSDLEEKYGKLQARLSVLEPALPDSAYMPTFLRQIEGLAVATHNRIIMIRPKETSDTKTRNVAINDETGEVVANKESGDGKKASGTNSDTDKPKLPYGKTDIEVKMQGSYWTIISFLNELREFPKMIAVNDIAFTPERAGMTQRQASGADVTATMSLSAVITKGGRSG